MIKLSAFIVMFFSAGTFAGIDVVAAPNGFSLSQSAAIKECRTLGRRLPTATEAWELYNDSLNADSTFELSRLQSQVKGTIVTEHYNEAAFWIEGKKWGMADWYSYIGTYRYGDLGYPSKCPLAFAVTKEPTFAQALDNGDQMLDEAKPRVLKICRGLDRPYMDIATLCVR